MEIDDKIEELIKGLKMAEEQGDDEKFIDNMNELFVHNSNAFNLAGALQNQVQYEQALIKYDETIYIQNKLKKYISRELNKLDDIKDKETQKRIILIKYLQDLEEGLTFTIATKNMCLGLYNKLNRSPGLAIDNFQKAAGLFDILRKKQEIPIKSKVMKLMFDYCSNLVNFSEALEDFSRCNYSNAKSKFQRVKIHMEKIIQSTNNIISTEKEFSEEFEKMLPSLHLDYRDCLKHYYDVDATLQKYQGNFSAAKQSLDKICENIKESLPIRKETQPPQVYNFQYGEYYEYLGEKYLIEGEILREQAKWDKAIEHFQKAREAWVEGADFYFKSNISQSIALQERLLNYLKFQHFRHY